jgi:signal transduction histidine kinase
LRADIATLRSAEWLYHAADPEIEVDELDIDLRNRLVKLISDYQWRGLTVNVTGSRTGILRLAPDVTSAIVDSIGACLENVLKHSGASVADVDLAYADDALTVIVSDQGVGFDVDQIAPDRLGLGVSVVERIRLLGGTAKVWSSKGAGTSIVLRVPIAPSADRREEAAHESA